MDRLHSLDFLRVFAMLLGLVIHAPILYYIPNIAKEFEIENIEPAEGWVWIILTFINNWRMPLFFLLSGFFAILMIKRKGISKFIRDRTIRIGLTCVFFSSLYDILDGSFDFTTGHLWFLYELMIFVLFFSLLYKIQTIKDLLCRSIPTKMFSVIVLWLIATAPLALFLNNWWNPLVLVPSETYFDLKIGNLVHNFSYFLAGVLFYSNQKISSQLAKNKSILLLGFISVMTFLLHLYSGSLTVSGVKLENLVTAKLDPLDPIMVVLTVCLRGLNTFFWCLFLIGMATKFINSGSATLRWFVELSYPIYLLHLVPIMMISAAFYQAGFSQINTFSLTIITGFIVCVILYYVFIKFTPLSWLVNGYHKSFLQLKFWNS